MEDRLPFCTTANWKWMWVIAPHPDVILWKLNTTQLCDKLQRWRNCPTSATSQLQFVLLHYTFYYLAN